MDIIEAFKSRFNASPTVTTRAPGRVNLLGEHVDYNDGLVLPAAIDRQVTIAAGKTDDRTVTIVALDLGKEVSFHYNDLEKRTDLNGKPFESWVLYPAGVAWTLIKAGYKIPAINAVISSDIPIGAGLSSSAAVEVGFAFTWLFLLGEQIPPMQLAQFCQRAENEFVGVSCGLMDQFTCTFGIEGHALYFDIRSLEWEPAPLPADTSLVIADSGIRRSLSNSAYNARRAACEQAVLELQRYLPSIRSLRDIEPTEFAAYSAYLSAEPRQRAEHVVKEIARVKSAYQALKTDNCQAFGALMYSGHASLRDLYEVSTPELDTLVEITRYIPGAIGSRLTGAGFGGCTINLVEEDHSLQFSQLLQEKYEQLTGNQAQVYVCKASCGAIASEFIQI